MKVHFGFFENYGDYESPCYGCETTVCGCTGENAIENTVDNWNEVTCKNCLKIKDAVKTTFRITKNLLKRLFPRSLFPEYIFFLAIILYYLKILLFPF